MVAPRGHVTVNGKVYPKGVSKEGPIICPQSGKRMNNGTAVAAHLGGGVIKCPTCGALVAPIWGDTLLAHTWDKHDRADQEVRNGKVVDK